MFPVFSHSWVLRAPFPAEGGSRSRQTHWPGGVSGLYKVGYVEQRWWAGLGFSVGCSSARSRCQLLGWWCDCHISSSKAKHYLLLPDKFGHYTLNLIIVIDEFLCSFSSKRCYMLEILIENQKKWTTIINRMWRNKKVWHHDIVSMLTS